MSGWSPLPQYVAQRNRGKCMQEKVNNWQQSERRGSNNTCEGEKTERAMDGMKGAEG